MRLKCPGCGTWLCDDEELNDDGDEVPIEMIHKGGGTWAVTEIEHTPERCAATRNDRAANARLRRVLERIASLAESASSSDAEYALVGIANAARAALEAP